MSEVKHNHVQLSKFLMKPFSHKTKEGLMVYYLDLVNMKIGEEKIKKLGTSPKYYYPNTEEYLKTEVESRVGEIFKSFKNVTSKNMNATISGTDLINIKRLFTYAFLRSPKFKEQVLDESIFLKFLSDKDQHNLILRFPESIAKIFDNYFVNIINNKSKKGFITGHSCFFYIKLKVPSIGNGIISWCMPIAPDCCIALLPNDVKDKFIKDGTLYHLRVSKDDEIIDFNNNAIKSEIFHTNRFVIGERDELERLLRMLSNE